MPSTQPQLVHPAAGLFHLPADTLAEVTKVVVRDCKAARAAMRKDLDASLQVIAGARSLPRARPRLCNFHLGELRLDGHFLAGAEEEEVDFLVRLARANQVPQLLVVDENLVVQLLQDVIFGHARFFGRASRTDLLDGKVKVSVKPKLAADDRGKLFGIDAEVSHLLNSIRRLLGLVRLVLSNR